MEENEKPKPKELSEDKEKPKEKEKTVEEGEAKPVSIVDEARAIRDEIIAARDSLKAENEKKEKLQADAMLGSSAGGHVDATPVKQTKEEYAEAFIKGEVNPLKDDGFI